MATQDTPRRRGRPPAADSAETKAKIFECARHLFGERGYGSVTNKDLAAEAGLTTGALYHYVSSKAELYAQVYDDVRARYYTRFDDAIAGSVGFVGQLEAVFDAAVALNREDPSIAKFISSLRFDVRRHEEVRTLVADALAERERYFFAIVERAVQTGEIADGDQALAWELIRLLLVGITEGAGNPIEEQALAIEAIKAMLDGRLIKPVPEAGKL
jgi:AcrR family transcriptional regulator